MKPTVFVVDDDDAVRKAVQLILEMAGHHILPFSSAVSFLEQYDPEVPGCLVSDVRMPGMDGMELLRELSDRGAMIPILMLSAHGDIPMAVRALKIGAIDFLEKPADPDVLREKVAAALVKDSEWRMDAAGRIEIVQLMSTLTAREREVLDLFVDGKDAKTVAKILGTSHNTVRVQRSSIMKKMQADNVADIVRMMSIIGRLGN